MIPKRTLTATLEISTGSLILTSRPPAFQGEVHALALVISLLDGGAAYTPTGNVVAQMYLYWPGTVEMTETVPLTISGSTLTGTLPETLTAVPGCPLLVIQITDADSGDLIVAAASPIQITNVLGGTVISTRPPTPSEIIYVGRSPYIDGVTGNWVQWDTDAGEYVDTGVHAKGDKGDQGIPGPVATVNGVQPDAQGNVQLSGANIPSSAITGAANVDAGLSALSGQIEELEYFKPGDSFVIGAGNITTYQGYVTPNKTTLRIFGYLPKSPVNIQSMIPNISMVEVISNGIDINISANITSATMIFNSNSRAFRIEFIGDFSQLSANYPVLCVVNGTAQLS